MNLKIEHLGKIESRQAPQPRLGLVIFATSRMKKLQTDSRTSHHLNE
jgi:hypothetical protein